jgi:hypothetical protein
MSGVAPSSLEDLLELSKLLTLACAASPPPTMTPPRVSSSFRSLALNGIVRAAAEAKLG